MSVLQNSLIDIDINIVKNGHFNIGVNIFQIALYRYWYIVDIDIYIFKSVLYNIDFFCKYGIINIDDFKNLFIAINSDIFSYF